MSVAPNHECPFCRRRFQKRWHRESDGGPQFVRCPGCSKKIFRAPKDVARSIEVVKWYHQEVVRWRNLAAALLPVMREMYAVLEDVATLAKQCDWCEGTGEDPTRKGSGNACDQCGGVGEVCEAGPELGAIRAVLAKAKQPPSIGKEKS